MTSLKELNAKLGEFPYVNGYTPSQADIAEYNALVNVRRWIKHLDSFSEAEKKAFPGVPKGGDKKAAPASKPEPKKGGDDDDDELDLFGDDVDEEAEKAKAERAAQMEAQKKEKKVVVAKSNVILDVKVWDDETDLKKVEEQVRAITLDGLLWGAAKTVPLAFGVSKLQIVCVVEDDKVSIDELTERIEELEDVQSTDIAAFQKI